MPCFTNVLQKHCTGGDTYIIKICPLQHNKDTDNMYMYIYYYIIYMYTLYIPCDLWCSSDFVPVALYPA